MKLSLPITNYATDKEGSIIRDYISCKQRFIDLLLHCCFKFSELLGDNGLDKDDCDNGRTDIIAKIRYV